MSDTPRIYVASLADYNAGRLHGAWIDCDKDADDIQAEIDAMLAESPAQKCGDVAEEFAIHDYDCFCGIKLHEYDAIEVVAELAAAIIEHGEAFALYVEMVGAEYATLEGFQEAYQGVYESEVDFAYYLVKEHGLLQGAPDALCQYFDYRKYARDLFIGDYWGDRDSKYNFHVFNR